MRRSTSTNTMSSCNCMEMFEVIPYSAGLAGEWNAFVARAKNATFLFDRRYMDYHADRFRDASLMVFDRKKGNIVALMPANRVGETLFSHQGLSFGGLLIDGKATAQAVCDMMVAANGYLRQQGFRRVIYRAMPWIYTSWPAEEPLYALSHVCKATLVSRDVASVIDLDSPLPFTELRRRGARRALRNGVNIKPSDDFEAFWTLLSDNLHAKYNATPVHSLSEINLLRSRFPDNIRLYAAFEGNTMLAGTVLYITERVVKTQYISASPRGKDLGALDLLFDQMVHQRPLAQRFLDLGTSALEHDNDLRLPLIFQKEGFGARAVCYDTYEWALTN